MRLRLRDRVVDTAERPLVMGILNTTPDSVSDGERYLTLDAQLERARELVAAGADLIDVGGESGPHRPRRRVRRRRDRAGASRWSRRSRRDGVVVSVDTWKPAVARAVVDAGAAMLNDVSGLRVAGARGGRGGVGRGARAHAHARGAEGGALPGLRRRGRRRRVDAARADRARARRSAWRRTSWSSTRARTSRRRRPRSVAVLRALPRAARRSRRPLLLAVSNKYFVGAITGRPPLERLGGTLAAMAHGRRQRSGDPARARRRRGGRLPARARGAARRRRGAGVRRRRRAAQVGAAGCREAAGRWRRSRAPRSWPAAATTRTSPRRPSASTVAEQRLGGRRPGRRDARAERAPRALRGRERARRHRHRRVRARGAPVPRPRGRRVAVVRERRRQASEAGRSRRSWSRCSARG